MIAALLHKNKTLLECKERSQQEKDKGNSNHSQVLCRRELELEKIYIVPFFFLFSIIMALAYHACYFSAPYCVTFIQF